MWPAPMGKRAAQAQWLAGLVWARLRYLEPAGPTRCLKLLSRPEASGRVRPYVRPGGPGAELYVGVPEVHGRLLKRMANDFGFSLEPGQAAVEIPAASRLRPTDKLPWERPFLAHIVNEQAFSTLPEGPTSAGTYFPPAAAALGPTYWQLPNSPPAGLTLKPIWTAPKPPAELSVAEPAASAWPLGWSTEVLPLQASGPVNLYGRQDAVADWLTTQVTRMVAYEPSRLVVIDGAGDLVPQLKRKAAVTRVLGKGLTYIDVDGSGLAQGLNPLVLVPGESKGDQLRRWRYWFSGMNVHPQGIELLAEAQAAAVADIPGLRKWLKQMERQGQLVAVSSLSLALSRLTSSRNLREWLAWPGSCLADLPEGALFLTCRATSWGRQQLLRAVLLAALALPDVRLILHGFPWQAEPKCPWQSHRQLLVVNGPCLPESTVVLSACHAGGRQALVDRFLAGDAGLGEYLALLKRGEGLVVTGAGVYPTRWSARVAASADKA